MEANFQARTSTTTWPWMEGALLTDNDKDGVASLVEQFYDYLVAVTNETTVYSAIDVVAQFSKEESSSWLGFLAALGLSALKDQDILEFSMIQINKIKVVFGTRIALLHADGVRMLESNPISVPGEVAGTTFNIEISRAYFFRKNGKWEMFYCF